MVTRLLIGLLFCCGGWNLIGSPASDLSLPSQEARDAAAKVLRSTYTPASRTNWEAVVSGITNGMTKTTVLELLSPFKVTPQGGPGGGGSYSESYRLDDAWILICRYRNKGDVLLERTLSPSLRHIWVAPPADYTGIWVTYYVNGQKSHEIHYDAGKYQGEFIAYNPDGSKCYVQHFDHQVAEGTDTGYFASGRTSYQGIYKAGKPVGTWTWYNEDGSKKSTKDYSK
jgi:hypothetical protein